MQLGQVGGNMASRMQPPQFFGPQNNMMGQAPPNFGGFQQRPPQAMGAGMPPGIDPRAVAANPQGFQNWMQGAQQQEAQRPGSTMYGGGQGGFDYGGRSVGIRGSGTGAGGASYEDIMGGMGGRQQGGFGGMQPGWATSGGGGGGGGGPQNTMTNTAYGAPSDMSRMQQDMASGTFGRTPSGPQGFGGGMSGMLGGVGPGAQSVMQNRLQGFGGGPGYSLQGTPPQGLGTGFGMGRGF